MSSVTSLLTFIPHLPFNHESQIAAALAFIGALTLVRTSLRELFEFLVAIVAIFYEFRTRCIEERQKFLKSREEVDKQGKSRSRPLSTPT